MNEPTNNFKLQINLQKYSGKRDKPNEGIFPVNHIDQSILPLNYHRYLILQTVVAMTLTER